MTEEIPKRPFKDRERQIRKDAKKSAYATLLEELAVGLEILYNDEMHYVVGVDGSLYEAKEGEEPVEIPSLSLELLFTGEEIYVVDLKELHQFEEVL